MADCFLTIDKSEATGNSKLNYTFSQNTTGSPRMAVVRAKDKNGEVVSTFTVLQDPARVYYNERIEREFLKNDCPATQIGSVVLYVVPEGKYSSYESQIDANLKAEREVIDNGQDYANEHGTCTQMVWYNRRASQKFTKNDCPQDYVGLEVEYVVLSGTYTSTISQEDADEQAIDDINANGQNYANQNGECAASIFYNVEKSEEYFSQNCPEGFEPVAYIYTIPARTYYSYDSQADADQKALDDILQNGQNMANINGTCSGFYYNDEMSQTLNRNNCPSGQFGSSVTYTVEAGKHKSTTSKEDANTQAQLDIENNAQTYANTHGTCSSSYVNKAVSKVFTKNNCESGYQGTQVTYTVPAGQYTSEISQADADSKANADIDANGQTYANKNGDCLLIYSNVYASQPFTRNDCISGTYGSEVLYEVPAGRYTSTVSQADADNKAQADITANGQRYANEHGTCNEMFYNDERRETFTKNDCPEGYKGTEYTMVVPAGEFGSRVSKADANAQADAYIQDNGQANANKNADCIQDVDVDPYWSDTGNTKCASSPTAAAGSGCNPYKEQKDTNVNSPSHNTIQWVDGTHSCTNPNWVNTGNVKCASSPTAANGTGDNQYVEQKDMNSCSPTSGKTQWISGDNSKCSPNKYTVYSDCEGAKVTFVGYGQVGTISGGQLVVEIRGGAASYTVQLSDWSGTTRGFSETKWEILNGCTFVREDSTAGSTNTCQANDYRADQTCYQTTPGNATVNRNSSVTMNPVTTSCDEIRYSQRIPVISPGAGVKPDWVTSINAVPNADGKTCTISFNLTANNTGADRSGKVYLRPGDGILGQITVDVLQKGGITASLSSGADKNIRAYETWDVGINYVGYSAPSTNRVGVTSTETWAPVSTRKTSDYQDAIDTLIKVNTGAPRTPAVISINNGGNPSLSIGSPSSFTVKQSGYRTVVQLKNISGSVKYSPRLLINGTVVSSYPQSINPNQELSVTVDGRYINANFVIEWRTTMETTTYVTAGSENNYTTIDTFSQEYLSISGY